MISNCCYIEIVVDFFVIQILNKQGIAVKLKHLAKKWTKFIRLFSYCNSVYIRWLSQSQSANHILSQFIFEICLKAHIPHFIIYIMSIEYNFAHIV